MFKALDFIAIGDITTDAFIRIKDASVHCKVDTSQCELCMRFGDKVPFESVHIVKAVGNSPNAAVAAARLGLGSALVANLGDDQNGRDCIAELKLPKNSVDTRYLTAQKGKVTNFHYVLWYEADRTILIHHEEYQYVFPEIRTAPKWIYLSSLGSTSFQYHLDLLTYLQSNPDVKLAFQPGTFQMKLGTEQLRGIYERSDVLILNVEEAQRVLSREEKGFMSIEDTKSMMKSLHALGPKIVLVTDGPKGAYMYDGDHSYFMPIYPDPKPPLERTGCGDSFASTFVSALSKGHTPLEALIYAPVNPMSVVQYIGAQAGLLTMAQIEELLKVAPADYKPREI